MNDHTTIVADILEELGGLENLNAEDFEDEMLYAILCHVEQGNPFAGAMLQKKFSQRANQVGFKGFASAYKAYKNSMKAAESVQAIAKTEPLSCPKIDFPYQLLNYIVSEDRGIMLRNPDDPERGEPVCSHPVLPVERWKNIETGDESLKLAYCRNHTWKYILVDKNTLASRSSIVSLCAKGLDITSDNADKMVRCISRLEAANYEAIPAHYSVSHCGYYQELKGFVPYVTGVEFDNAEQFPQYIRALQRDGAGDALKALNMLDHVRNFSIPARILLAASFGSVLVKPLNVLPFTVHLQGDTGTGKTVAAKAAASIWADPEHYLTSFNSTAVGFELAADFLRELPVIIDEAQIAREGKSGFSLYTVNQGTGRQRGNTKRGVDRITRWNNIFITTGEESLYGSNAFGGEMNRVINIDSKSDWVVPCEEAGEVLRTIGENYGMLGNSFVYAAYVYMEEIKQYFREAQEKLQAYGKYTGKQIVSAALLDTADYFADLFLFCDKQAPHSLIEPLTEYLLAEDDVSPGVRGYAYFRDWLTGNQNHFSHVQNEVSVERYGYYDVDYYYIIPSQFEKAMRAEGFDAKTVLRYMARIGAIEKPSASWGFGKAKRIGGNVNNYYWMRRSPDNAVDAELV